MSLAAPSLIFVRPQAAGNIGALARVMSNFGSSELRLVGSSPVYGHNPEDPFSRMDWAMATKRGEKIVRGAQWFPTLVEALSDFHLVIGTSGRAGAFERGYARPLVSPDEAFDSVARFQSSTPENFRWALVMGPEDDGLTDHEAALCQLLISLPTTVESPSLNIAMAAGLVLYHLQLRNLKSPATSAPTSVPSPFPASERPRFTETGRMDFASFAHKEEFLKYLMATLSKTQFLKYPDNEAVEARVRRWLQLAPIPLGELLFAFEIVYHLRAWGSGTFEKRDFLKRPTEPDPC